MRSPETRPLDRQHEFFKNPYFFHVFSPMATGESATERRNAMAMFANSEIARAGISPSEEENYKNSIIHMMENTKTFGLHTPLFSPDATAEIKEIAAYHLLVMGVTLHSMQADPSEFSLLIPTITDAITGAHSNQYEHDGVGLFDKLTPDYVYFAMDTYFVPAALQVGYALAKDKYDTKYPPIVRQIINDIGPKLENF